MEANDPYRAARRDRNDAVPCGNAADAAAAHSRSGSDSSTKRLAPRQNSYNDDPYASNERANHRTNIRANSYLPYSNHQRDPLAPVPPIYVEDNASIAHDRTISLQVDSLTSMPEHHPDRRMPGNGGGGGGSSKLDERSLPTPLYSKKRRRQGTCCCYTRWRMISLISVVVAAVIAVIWYFVWPRIPSLALDDADDSSENPWIKDDNNTIKAYNTTWMLNMTADNTDNWIPTRISNMAVTVVDHNTSVAIGSGNSGALVLAPRATQLVNIPVAFLYWNSANDATFQDLVDACFAITKEPMGRLQLNVDFIVTIHIAGIAWSSTQIVPSPAGFTCPT